MTSVTFRNVDADPTDAVRTWPYEALVTAVERGLVDDWQPLFAEVRRSPWGAVARRLERIVDHLDDHGARTLFTLAIERAREETEAQDRAAVAGQVQDAVARSGLSQGAFATEVGTSAARLSTYVRGHVSPSAALLRRIERTADRLATERAHPRETPRPTLPRTVPPSGSGRCAERT